jgi:tol-pal system protein YbgF
MFPRTLISGLLALPFVLMMALPSSAQGADQRVSQLEEQVRQLTGTLEELNFQILQMQDQLRRMQEDNELRFQELEGGASTGNAGTQQQGKAGTSGDDEFYAQAPRVEDGARVEQPARVEDGARIAGAPPRDFGTITFDANGHATGAGVAPPPAPADNTTVAALPPQGDSDDELYRNAYEFVLQGDYGTAEAGFRTMIERFPQSDHAADAHFWLGESLLAQQRPREAAEIFLSASRTYPQARKAPDTLFKLGVSLAAMNQRDVACATFTEVLQRYPQATDALKNSISQQQKQASC